MELLKQLYEIHSPSGSEKRMKKFIKKYIRQNVPDAIIQTDHGNLYITRGTSDYFPCIVAHLDQVQRHHSPDFKAIETADIIFGYSSKNREMEGLGADDKNGIWVALRCLESFENIKVVFFVAEEIGCIGSTDANMNFFTDCRFVLQCDRKGYKDLIMNGAGVELASDDFVEATNYKEFGYTLIRGSITDVVQLKENGLNISALNISCGYYDPHTSNEFTVKTDLLHCLDFTSYIIRNCTGNYPHEAEENFQNYYYYADYGFEEDALYEMIEGHIMFHPDATSNEIYRTYHPYYPKISQERINEMVKEAKREI